MRRPEPGTILEVSLGCWELLRYYGRIGLARRYLRRPVPGNQCNDSNDYQIKYPGNHAIAGARVFGGFLERISHPINSARRTPS